MLQRKLMGVLPCVAVLAGCQSQGPGRLPGDRFDYNQAVATSAKEQMLLNVVRLRYGEIPTFLEVSSVLTQYVYAAGAGANGAWGASLGDPAYSVGGDASFRYIERPTITYSPLTGLEFAAQMTRPVPADLLFSLVQSGWPPDKLLVMCLQRLNDLHNQPFMARGERDAREFRRAIELMIDLSARNALETQSRDPGSSDRYLVFAENANPETMQRIAELKQLLGLALNNSSFLIRTTVVGRRPDEMTMRVRSLLELMAFLSRGVRVPAEHLEQNRVRPRSAPVGPRDRALEPLVVLAQREKPESAFVAVHYQDYWFYVAHDDHESKEAFGLLTYLFQMQAPQVQGAGPLLTVPTG